MSRLTVSGPQGTVAGHDARDARQVRPDLDAAQPRGAEGLRHGFGHAPADLGAEVSEQLAHRADVPHLGNVVEDDGLLGEQRGADVGQGRVLGSADADGAFQGTTAHYADLFH